MSVRAVLGVAVLALVGAAWVLRGSSTVVPPRPAPAALRSVPAPVPPAATPSLRNVFEYLDRPAPVPGRALPPRESAPVAPPSAEPREAASPVRLVGIVRRGGELAAALSIDGEVVVLAKGETASGYAVLSIDEDEGVSLRGRDGATVRLVPDAR